MIEAGVIPPLVDLLRSPTDATRKAAASALWNLAYRNNANRWEGWVEGWVVRPYPPCGDGGDGA